MNEILNTIDGVETKGRSILTIFTTNHHKRINPALRRPGRIDLIVNFSNPNKDTVKKISEKFFLNLNGGDTLDYDAIAEKMPEAQGAVIAEICKRSLKLYQKEGKITQSIVEAAIVSIKHQTEFMNDDVEKSNSLQDAFYQVRNFFMEHENF
jgi:ATP-dependent 26S proteasome regulatory subunit